jgi:hypothetical protein
MALPSSGPLSLSQVNTELDLTPKSQINLNSAIVRALFERPSGTISFSNGYGKASAFVATITTNQSNLNLRSWALANGWNGTSVATITVAPGVYIWSNNTSIPALTIDGSWAGGLELVNNGFIIGMGGAGGYGLQNGFAGGSAISLGISTSIRNNNYIAGGGGGGGGGSNSGNPGNSGGGGGAGGGNGGNSTNGGNPGSSGGTGSTGTNIAGGGGGGRILPGTGGAGPLQGLGANSIGGGGGGAGGGGGVVSFGVGTFCQFGPQFGFIISGGGGGGGWGASGGLSGTDAGCVAFDPSNAGGSGGGSNSAGGDAPWRSFNSRSGGTGGRAVQLNGHSVTWLATGTRWGAIS